LLLGYPLSSVAGDLVQLLALTVASVMVGTLALRWAFAYARRAGSLSQY
jgi:hypothetical protein